MVEPVQLLHVALQNESIDQAELFYESVLGCKKKKTFRLEKTLAKEIFGLDQELEAIQFDGEIGMFEIFICPSTSQASAQHVCIAVKDRDSFLLTCRRYDIVTQLVHRGEKTLYFIRDFSGNLFEVKEQISKA